MGGVWANLRGYVAAAAVVVLVTGCDEQVAVQAQDPPRKFAAEGHDIGVLWSAVGPTDGVLDDGPVALYDKVVYATTASGVSAFDVTSGEKLWQVDSRWGEDAMQPARRRPPVQVRVDGRQRMVAAFGGDVAGSGTKVGHRECEVFSVDPHTGEKLWQASFRLAKTPEGQSEPEAPRLIGADDEVAVIGYGGDSYGFDLVERTLLWRRVNLVPAAYDDGVVVGLTRREASGATRLIGVRGSDRKVAWRVQHDLTEADVSFAGPGLVGLYGTSRAGGERFFSLMRMDSGKVLDKGTRGDDEGSAVPQSCRFDGTSTTVCQGSRDSAGERLAFAYDVESGKKLWSLPRGDRVAPEVTAVFHGVVYAELDGKRLLLDARTGADERGDPTVSPVLVSRFGAVVKSEQALTVHPAVG